MSTIKKFDLSEKVAIITGASKGIGKSMAMTLAENGAKVVISSRNQEAVDEVVKEIVDKGYSASSKACHVGKSEELNSLVNYTIEQYGRIDVLINNAATNPVFGAINQANEKSFDKIMNVNVKACMLLANLCHPHLRKNGGSIINISSVEGIKPSFGLAMYSMSKAALIMLTKNQAKEWGADNIRCNAICPGLIKTKFSAAIWKNPDFLQQYETMLPLGRMAQPEELNGLALYLASDASSYCTGSVFTVDGGHLIGG